MATLNVSINDELGGTISGAAVATPENVLVTLPRRVTPVSQVTIGDVAENETFQFSATVNDGYEFIGWSTNLNIKSGYLTDASIRVATDARERVSWSISGTFRRIVEPTITPTPTQEPIVITPTPTPTPTIIPRKISRQFKVPILVEIIAKPQPVKNSARIEVTIAPAEFPQQVKNIEYKFNVQTRPIQINISEPLIFTANEFLRDIINVYVDEERELKTLLNYGEDRQSVALAYRSGPIDISGIDSIQLKLLQPVPDDVTVNTSVFLSREVVKTIIDKVRVRFTPEIDATPYLRPKNLKAKVDLDTGKFLKNVTLNKLSLNSGSVGLLDQYQNKNFEDEIFRQWYSYDFNSSELNINFTNYENFIFYSSAAMRLAAFKQKLQEIERLESLRTQFETNYATTSSAAIVFLQEKSAEYSVQKENIIRAFDRYEQYLFFTPSGSNTPYSASFDYVDGGTEYNSLGYWPKSGSVLWPANSEVATNWYETQLAIAQRYDEFNENNLVNTIPTYLREDHESSPYLTFVSMIGQLFDNIKLYIDQFPYIYSRNLNPNEELSKDLISEIAESIGFKLPTVDSVYNLTDNILGTNESTPRRDLAAEIYKRLLHNLPFFAKAKGTKTALETLLKTFGITSQLLTVRETGTPTSSSYRVFDEYTTGLDFDETNISYVQLPILASNRDPVTLQLNCTVAKSKEMTILTGDNKWALNVSPHPTISRLGRFEIISGSTSTKIVTSSYYPIFGDELLNITIKNYANTSSFYFTQVEGEDVLFTQTLSNSDVFPALWSSSQYVNIGGAGTLVTNRFDGTIDEIRLWGTPLSDEVILNTAFDPASNAGDVYSDASDYLYIQISFDNITSGSIAANSIKNDSPYKDKLASPSLENIFTFNVTESDFIRYNRTIKQYTPVVGSSTYLTNKIVVADEPKFINDRNGLRLYRNKSIVEPGQKKFNRGRSKVIVAMSPTEIVNQNIIRTLGLENINSVLGAPTTLYTNFEKSLNTLKNHYQQYHYVDINTNKFIRILSDLSSVLNQVIDYFIPSRATLLKGIVIEPNILEQVKIPPIRNLRFYGKNTKKTINAPGSLTGSNADYGATFNLSQTIKTSMDPSASAQYSTYRAQLDSEDVVDLMGNYSSYKTSVNVTDASNVTGSYTTYKAHVEQIVADVEAVISQYNTNIESIGTNVTASFLPLSADISNEENIIDGNYSVVKTNIIVDTDDSVVADYDTYRIQHYGWDYTGPAKDSRIDMQLDVVNKIPYNDTNKGSDGAEPYNRVYTRKLFDEEIRQTRISGVKSLYTPALYDIPPVADFRDVGVYTYFNNNTGVYYFNEIKKIPAYPSPLNTSWDFNTQTFGNTVATWSYGDRYNKNDVVYQEVTDATMQLVGVTGQITGSLEFLTAKSLVKSATGGNKRYYVFKNRPSYGSTVNAGSFYSGSIPTYVPPSLDGQNWDVLRFKPIQVRVPKRVVFDTFTIRDPILNNFKTTTVSVDRVINIPERYIDLFEIGTIGPNSFLTGELALQNIAVLFAIQSNVGGLRLRLYRSAAAQQSDFNRSVETRPVGSHGVLLDTSLVGVDAVEISNPMPTLVAGQIPPEGKIYYTLDNLDSSTKLNVTLLLYYFALEIEPRVPQGYLKKHYRFFRDNSTATKRRNYLGCKNTQETTIDGRSPVEVTIGEGTEIQVAPSTGNQEIITGGGGILNVT